MTANDLDLSVLSQFNREEIQQYRRFLDGVKAGREPRSLLSAVVDKVWHAHILHTRKYAEDCQRLLGYFLHHTPDPPPGQWSDAQLDAWKRLEKGSCEGRCVGPCKDRDARPYIWVRCHTRSDGTFVGGHLRRPTIMACG